MIAIEKRLDRMKSFIETDEYKKYTNNFLEGMSRNERKNYERKEEKLKQCIRSLTPMQLELVEQRADMKANEKIDEFKGTLDRAISALLIESFPDKTLKDIESLEEYYSDLVLEDVKKLNEIIKKCGGNQHMVNKSIQKYENEVRAKGMELLERGLNQKQAMEILVAQFPMLSKSMLTNAYKKLKGAWEKEHEKEEVDPDVKEALETISDIIDEEDEKSVDKVIKEADEYVKQAEKKEQQPKVVCNGNSCSIGTQPEIKEENVVKEAKGLKVLSMNLQGENGNYKVCQNGVELSNGNMVLSFENEEQLDSFVNEFKQVFAMVK